jgi:hypothetical protein
MAFFLKGNNNEKKYFNPGLSDWEQLVLGHGHR